MNNIFLFDIDGTLSIGGYVPKSAQRTLSELRKKGNIVMLATGRCLGQMSDIIPKVEFDGAILNNGAFCQINGEDVFESPIDNEIIYRMHNDGLNVSALLKDQFVYFRDNEVFKVFADYFKINTPDKIDINELEKRRAYSLGLYDFNPDAIDLTKYNLKFVKVNQWGFDVMNPHISKASPFQSLKEKFPGYKIIAFGDNYNDLEMLDAADISVAMGSAPEDVKSHATFVTKDVKNNGIEYAVKELLRKYYED